MSLWYHRQRQHSIARIYLWSFLWNSKQDTHSSLSLVQGPDELFFVLFPEWSPVFLWLHFGAVFNREADIALYPIIFKNRDRSLNSPCFSIAFTNFSIEICVFEQNFDQNMPDEFNTIFTGASLNCYTISHVEVGVWRNCLACILPHHAKPFISVEEGSEVYSLCT